MAFKKKDKKDSELVKLDNSSGSSPVSKKKKWKKIRKRIAWLIILVIVVVGGYFGYNKYVVKEDESTDSDLVTYTVEKQDITQELTGTATLEPANSYTVSTSLTGDILNSYFEEGDEVSADDVLFEIDSSEASNSIEKAQLSLEEAQRDYEEALEDQDDLTVTAPVDGQITDLAVDVGDEISSGDTIATIVDSDTMLLKIPFNSVNAENISVGDTAEITVEGSFDTVSGTVSKISSITETLQGNVLSKEVTIEVTNPGGLTEDDTATAVVDGYSSVDSGDFSYNNEETVTADVGGTVSSLPFDEGDMVTEGQTIAQLTSESITDSITNAKNSVRTAEISLEDQEDELDDYTPTSPIDGTIVELDYNAGDNLIDTDGSTLAVIYDLSYLTMTLDVDELDIQDVSEGQEVTITSDAIDDTTFEGVVTSVNINGTTSNNVTTYPVTIEIDDPGDLLPGMNVDVSIIVASAEDALVIPTGALERGNQVLVQTSDATDSDATQEGPDAAPSGYEYVEVETGVNNDDYIEITSGLSEGDVIAYDESDASSTSSSDEEDSMMFGGQGGQGGAPSGGGPGGGGPGGM